MLKIRPLKLSQCMLNLLRIHCNRKRRSLKILIFYKAMHQRTIKSDIRSGKGKKRNENIRWENVDVKWKRKIV